MHASPDTERNAARFIDDHYQGFGPKQSRNLLQGLGLSRFDVPIDSRITKWLNEFGFPVKLTVSALRHQTTGYDGMKIPRIKGNVGRFAGCWRLGRRSCWPA